MGSLSDSIPFAQVNLADLPEKTKWVDNTVLSVTESTSLSFVVVDAWAKCTRDSEGLYSLEFNVTGTKTNSSGPLAFSMTGVSASTSQRITVYDAKLAIFNAGTDEVETGAHVVSGTNEYISGKIILDAKPSWFDANREAGNGVIAQIPLATADTAGLVPNYESTTVTLDGGFTGGGRVMTLVKIGDSVTFSYTSADFGASFSNASSVTSSAGLIPSRFRPSASEVASLYHMAADGVYRIKVTSAGTVSINFLDWAGSAVSRTDSGTTMHIVWAI